MKKQKAKPALSAERVFALKGWSVRTKDGKFFAAPTAYFDEKPKWLGPFKSLQSTTAAIARRLSEEFSERKTRLDAFRPKGRRS